MLLIGIGWQMSLSIWAVMTGYHRISGLYTTNIDFSQFQRLTSKSKIKARTYLVSAESLLPGLQTVLFLLSPPMVKGVMELSGDCYRALSPP